MTLRLGILARYDLEGLRRSQGTTACTGRGPGDLGPKVAQRWFQVGRHAATTESKSSKTRRQRGTGSQAAARWAGRPGGQMGRVGQPTKLANLLQVLGTVPGTCLGVSRPAPLGPGPSEWRPTLRQPSLSPTFLPTPSYVRRAVGTCEKQGRLTLHTPLTHSHTDPASRDSSTCHPRSAKTRARRQIKQRR